MADEEIQSLRKRHHDLSDIVQKHAVDLALKGQEMHTMKAEIGHLRDASVTHDELTGALGPLRGEIALTKQSLENAVTLMHTDSGIIKRDIAAIEGHLTWISRTIIGAVLMAVLGLIWQVAK